MKVQLSESNDEKAELIKSPPLKCNVENIIKLC